MFIFSKAENNLDKILWLVKKMEKDIEFTIDFIFYYYFFFPKSSLLRKLNDFISTACKMSSKTYYNYSTVALYTQKNKKNKNKNVRLT